MARKQTFVAVTESDEKLLPDAHSLPLLDKDSPCVQLGRHSSFAFSLFDLLDAHSK